jgi:glutamate-5-semialdehyde dehydrogenase
MPILFGGNRVTHVPEAVADAFRPGDRLVVIQDRGDLLHIPAREWESAQDAVTRAWAAFQRMGAVGDDQITRFYDAFASRLADDAVWGRIAQANQADVAAARSRGRSTTRLAVSDSMRANMVAGLQEWRDMTAVRGRLVETIKHDGWQVEQVTAALGVVGFVFEGRPNVFADASGVLRGGNTVVFRIGSDALGTARAIVAEALDPALQAAGLPNGAVSLVDSAERSAGWALFSDPRLSLAVARGSGEAVAQLGAVARQAGIPVSLHGTGGAWIIAAQSAEVDNFTAAVFNSLDRKVCNTLNVCVIVRERAHELTPLFLDTLKRAGERRGHGCKLHVAEGSEHYVPATWFQTPEIVRRAGGDVEEMLADVIPLDQLGVEWEWEESPEVTFVVVDSVADAVALFNRYSPQFIASLITEDDLEFQSFFEMVNAPFVGNGFTRWVDGQYALRRPELGLSNWQTGRLFARGGVLSGDGIYTLRTRVWQDDPDVKR